MCAILLFVGKIIALSLASFVAPRNYERHNRSFLFLNRAYCLSSTADKRFRAIFRIRHATILSLNRDRRNGSRRDYSAPSNISELWLYP